MPADTPPLIGGSNDIAMPKWAAADQRVAAATWWQTVRSVPAAVALIARLAWRTSPRWTVLAAVVHLASGCVTALGLLSTANVLTLLLEQGPTPERVLASMPAIALVAAAYATRACLDSVAAMAQAVLAPRVEQAAQDDAHVAVIGAEAAAFDDADFCELVRQGGRNGVESIRRSVTGVTDLLSSLVSLVAAIVTVAVLGIALLPVLLLAAVADAWAAMSSAKLGYKSFLRMVAHRRRLWVIGDLITEREAAAEVRGFTTQQTLLDEYRRTADEVTDESIRVEYRQTRVQLTGRALAGIGTAGAYVVLGLLLYWQAMPLALAGAAVLAMRTASSALNNTVHGVNRLYENSFFVDLHRTLLTEARARHRPSTGLAAPENPEVIRLEDVSYTYPGQDSPALQDISLTIRRGEVIALVGENGSGKSTLGKLVTGICLPAAGRVLWDGVDLAGVDAASVHGQIAVIMQEPLRWPMSARDNIRVGRLERAGPDDDRWRAAARDSGADEVIAELPLRENTVLSRHFEHGHDLSGGQWQRVSVARGAYRDAPLLVADEPTAALDARAEARVFRSLQAASRDGVRGTRTTLLVTHRLANIRHADRIVVLEHGRIIETGTHEELMRLDGVYAELFSIQAAAYRY